VKNNQNKSETLGGYPKSEWVLGGIIFVVGAICVVTFMDSPAEQVRKIEERETRYRSYEAADKAVAVAKLAGEKALEDADTAIRTEAAERRANLEKASTHTTMSNRNGVRIDHYFLKDRRVITCTTTISGNSPAMFNCDGNL